MSDPCFPNNREIDPVTSLILQTGCIPAIVNRALLKYVFPDYPQPLYWSLISDWNLMDKETEPFSYSQKWIIPTSNMSFTTDDFKDSGSSVQDVCASNEPDVSAKI